MANFAISVIKSGLGVLTSRIFGLIRDIVIAAVYGATQVTDAFFVAFAIPNLFRALFAEGALSSAFVPILSDKFKQNRENSYKYFTDMIIVLSIMLSIIILLVIIFSNYIIILFLPGYSDNVELVKTASNLLIILMPYLLFVSICGLFAGFLNLLGSYFVPYSSTALLNISMITGAILGAKNHSNIYYLAYSVIIGGVLQLLYIFIYSKKMKIKTLYSKPIEPDVKKTFNLILPAIAGVGINQLNFLVGRILASFLGFGSISFLYYANRLLQFPMGIFSITIGTVSLTELSKAYTLNDYEKLSDILSKAFVSILLIIIPSTIGLFFLSEEITALIYQRLSFNTVDTYSTATALQMYSIGLIFFSFVNLFNKAFHANKDTKTPVKVAFLSFIFNLIFSVLLIKQMGHSGIALAASISSFINALILYKMLEIKLKLNLYKNLIIKIIFTSFLMSFILLYLKSYSVNILVNIFTCIIFYLGMLFVLKVNIKKVLR